MNAEKGMSKYEQTNLALFKTIVKHAVYFLIGAVVCRGMIFSTLAPFGASYVAAAPRKQLFYAALGTTVGYIILRPADSFRYVAVVIAVAVVRWLVQDIKAISGSLLLAPGLAFLPVFASGIALTFVSTSTLADFTTVTVEALFSAGTAFFMERTLFLFSSKRRISTFSTAELADVVLTGCVCLLSLGSVELEHVSLGRILAVMVILISARYGSAAGGAISGAATGAIFGISETSMAFLCAGYSFGGLVSGLFAPIGKLGVAIGFVISNSVMLLSTGKSESILPLFAATRIASAAFMLLPRELERFVTPFFLPDENTRGEESLKSSVVMRLDYASNALKNVSGCVNSVSRRLEKLYAPSVEYVYETAAEEVCAGCGLRGYCYERRKAATKQDFTRLSAPLRSQGFVTENDVETLFSKKCCRAIELADSVSRSYSDYLGGIEASERVAQIRSLVAGQFSGLSEILGNLAGEFRDFRRYDSDTAGRVTEHLHAQGYVVMECGCMLDESGRMSLELRLGGRRPVKKSVFAKELSAVCGRCFDTPLISEIGSQKRVVLNEVPVYDIEVGVFQHVCNGGKLCGDCVNCFSNGFGDFVALISDGMGTGGRAAVDSNMTVSILTRLLKAGLDEDCALQVVNSALMVKSEDESLSTVDLMKINLFSGKAVFNKAGAPFSYVKKNGRLLKRAAESLPVGIIGDVKFSKESVKLSGGDVVVMLSDGAIAGDDKWLEKIIRDFDEGTCADLAKTVVKEAMDRRKAAHDDDITAVAVKLIEN